MDENYGVSVYKSGMTVFESVLSCGKPIASAVRDLSAELSGKGKVTVTYADGCEYKLECNRTETADKIALTDIKETWKDAEGNTYDL